MTDFNPNDEPETQEQADAYVNWCAENFMRLSEGPLGSVYGPAGKRTYRTALRCAHWLFVVATAQLHLDEDIEGDDAEALLDQLVRYQQLGRALERQRERFPVEQLIVLRASLDCWQPVGQWAANLLAAAKCAVATLLLIDTHPLIDLWGLEAPDAWALLGVGRDYLAAINAETELRFEHYTVRRDDMVAAKFTWQRANHLVRHVGMPKLSEN